MLKRIVCILGCLLLLGVLSACATTSTPDPTASMRTEGSVESAEWISTPISGWKKFEGLGMEIWLPESYIGGDLAENLDEVVDTMTTMRTDFKPIAERIEQNAFLYVVWAFDSVLGESGFLTHVSVVNEEPSSDVSVDSYLDLWVAQLPEQFQVTDRTLLSVGDDQVGRLFIEATLYDLQAKEAIYVIKDGAMFWVITFVTGLSEFDQRVPEFEQAMLTFRAQP